jgi:XTP/dITP diphosphohydrolase
MKRLIIATHNNDKGVEFRTMLSGSGVEVLTLDSFPSIGAIPETGETLEENSLLKADAVYRATGLPSLADDTGLEVFYLAMAPGVCSSRYAGEGASYADNVAKLLRAMKGVPARRRGARFRCVLTFMAPGCPPAATDGVCKGNILEAPRGGAGFGYDPVFLPSGADRAFAELDPESKNAISHRGRAMQKMRLLLNEYFNGATVPVK